MAKALEIGSNLGAMLTFDSHEALSGYAGIQSHRLAGLLYVLKNCSQVNTDGFMEEAMHVAADMAFELEQAVELLVARQE